MDKLAKMSASERAQLLQYTDEMNRPKNGKYHQGDVREDGKVFLRYHPVWVTPEQFARHKATVDRCHARTKALKESEDTNCDRNSNETPKETRQETPDNE